VKFLNQRKVDGDRKTLSGVPQWGKGLNVKLVNCHAIVLVSLMLSSLVGCQSLYFDAMEKLGYHKRDLLVSRVEDARDSQEQAKEQFRSALDRFSTVLNFHGGTLQGKYEQ